MHKLLQKFTCAAMLLASYAVHAQTGLYAGGDLMVTKADRLGTSAGGGLFVGFNFNKNVGVELGYKELGSFDYDGFPTDAQAVQASVLVSYPITEKTDIYGRIGVTNLNAAVRDSAFAKKANGLHAGIGLKHEISESIKVRAEFQSISKVVNQITVSALFEF